MTGKSRNGSPQRIAVPGFFVLININDSETNLY